MRSWLAALVLALAAATASAAPPATWQQWRGPNRDGTVPAGTPWPDTLKGDAIRVAWKAEDLGESYCGPIVAADRVFDIATVGKKKEVVRALDRTNGKELWKVEWDGALTVPFFAAKNGDWVRCTPACDGETLYVGGIRDVLVALDTATGKERWRLDFPTSTNSPLPAFGFVSSPLIVGDAVFVQAGASLAKVEKSSGKLLWQTLKDDGGMNGSAFSSPVLATVAGKKQILVQTRTRLAGVDPGNGDVLWTRPIASFRGMNILTPVPFEDGVFTSTYGGNTQWFRVDSEGGKLVPNDGWSFKYEGHMSTPVVVAGHAYVQGKDQRLLCIDLKTGKEAWGTDQRFGLYWSMVTNGDKILALDQRGTLYLLKANPKEYEPLDERKLNSGETWAHLAVCGDEVYVRDLHGLTRYSWNAGK